ncbi:hypothetical protein H2201_002739 [Coniosporium apollinis]|uniref:Uncharacterized protein n=1 Tax=Coniosporium apollinis TaxID=61459 RepID=A0ABQ9NZP9_9PEZI|nr:hypothetical protein H2201_002739 [Coniosporium apollinis]
MSELYQASDYLPKFLSLAASHPFVKHSILAFSASHLAWISTSPETRNLAFHYGGIALKGLHEAIGNFSRTNSDAVVASSLLLSWQATDWKGWASLMSGIKTVSYAMQSWRHESRFADYLGDYAVNTAPSFSNAAGTPVTQEARHEHLSTLQLINSSLQRMRPYLANYDQESKWIDQLVNYVDRLRSSSPPQTADEQFSQMYALRKWLFWVPVTLLSARKGDVNVLVVLAHFYAAALALEPMFPDIGAPFCADMALPPLEEILRIITALQVSQNYSQAYPAAFSMAEFPRQVASNFQSRKDWTRQQAEQLHIAQQSPRGLDILGLDLEDQIADYNNYGRPSLSPAFAPSPMGFAHRGSLSGAGSPFLEVPRSSIDGYGFPVVSTFSTTPVGSPATPLLGGFTHEPESMYGWGSAFGYPGGEQQQQQQQFRLEQPPHGLKGKGKGRDDAA